MVGLYGILKLYITLKGLSHQFEFGKKVVRLDRASLGEDRLTDTLGQSAVQMFFIPIG
jgi:hypothetical protein